MSASPVRLKFTPVDVLLLFLVIIWGTNFSVVKVVVAEIPPFGFNTLRLITASVVLLLAVRVTGAPAPARSAWPRLLALGFFGHCCYQLSFISGLVRTSVTNTSLILGCMPVAVLILNAASRHRERVRWPQWTGIALASLGVYLVVGVGASASGDTQWGDLLTIAAVWCWAWYTIGSRTLLAQYSPLQVSAYTTLIGTMFFVPFGVTDLVNLNWGGVSVWAWGGLIASGVLALSVSHIIWHMGVQRLGSARTSIYSNLIPVAAMTVATIWLSEPIGWSKMAGAALVVGGLLLARVERTTSAGG